MIRSPRALWDSWGSWISLPDAWRRANTLYTADIDGGGLHSGLFYSWLLGVKAVPPAVTAKSDLYADQLWAYANYDDHGVRWVIDPALARLLLSTDPPAMSLPADQLRLPFDSLLMDFSEANKAFMSINAAPVDQHGGPVPERPVWLCGIFLTRDRVPSPDRMDMARLIATLRSTDRNGIQRSRAADPLLVDAIGIVCADESLRSAVSTQFFADVSLTEFHSQTPAHAAEPVLWAFVLNFLVAYRAGYLEVVEEKRPWPKSRKKQKRLERHGETPTRIIVRLGKRSKHVHRPDAVGGGTGAHPRAHWVRGHWRGYWLLDITDENPIRSKTREDGKTEFLVLRWIMPFIRAGDEAAKPEYKLVDGRKAKPKAQRP